MIEKIDVTFQFVLYILLYCCLYESFKTTFGINNWKVYLYYIKVFKLRNITNDIIGWYLILT